MKRRISLIALPACLTVLLTPSKSWGNLDFGCALKADMKADVTKKGSFEYMWQWDMIYNSCVNQKDPNYEQKQEQKRLQMLEDRRKAEEARKAKHEADFKRYSQKELSDYFH